MPASLPTIRQSDIDEIKADGKAMLAAIHSLSERLATHDARESALETTVQKIDLAVFGDGTKDNPGHIAEANHRISELERVQGSWSKAMWAIFTPILGLFGVGIIILLVMALAVK
jgi:hypothetical protein